MKSTLFSLVIVIIVMITVPMFFLGDGSISETFGFGKRSNNSGTRVDLEKLKEQAPQNMQAVRTDEKVEVYKWVDENGVIQFSQTPPEKGGESEKVLLTPDSNVIQALNVPKVEDKPVGGGPTVLSTGSPYTPEGMSELMKQAAGMQDLVNQRAEQQQDALKDLNLLTNKK